MHGNGELSGVAGGLSLGMARHAETAPDAAVRPGDTNPVSPTDEGRMTNLEVMLAGRPEIKAEMAGLCAASPVPFAVVLRWLEALAGTSSSMHDFSRLQAERVRDLEVQVDGLTEACEVADTSITSLARENIQMQEVVRATMRETEAERMHRPDGPYAFGMTAALLASARKDRAAAVEALSVIRSADYENLGKRADEPRTISEIKSVSHASLDPKTGELSVAFTMEHDKNCTGCAVCETAGA